MKLRAALFIAAIAVVLLSALALAQSGEHDPLGGYAVEPGTASGGRYHLNGLVWQMDGAANGGGYRLLLHRYLFAVRVAQQLDSALPRVHRACGRGWRLALRPRREGAG